MEDTVLDCEQCLSSSELAGIIDCRKEDSNLMLASMFATGFYSTDKDKVEMDVIEDELDVGMMPFVPKCYHGPDLYDDGFYTQEFRPPSLSIRSQINNCDRCPMTMPGEREYTTLSQQEKLDVWRLSHLRKHDRMWDNRKEWFVASIMKDSGYDVRYQDEMGKETQRFRIEFPRNPWLDNVVATSHDDPNANVVCDIEEFLQRHSEEAECNVNKVILGANVYKCWLKHRQFDLCGDQNCTSDLRRLGAFDIDKPCVREYDGGFLWGTYCGVEYHVYNKKMKLTANGPKEYILDPDCIYTVCDEPDPIWMMYSKFQPLFGPPVDGEMYRREYMVDRPEALEIETRVCGGAFMVKPNRFGKLRVKF